MEKYFADPHTRDHIKLAMDSIIRCCIKFGYKEKQEEYEKRLKDLKDEES